MAWEKRYILQWQDVWGVRWTANLFTQDYPSDPEYLEGSEEAIEFEFRNDTDAAFGCLKPSSVTLNVIRDTPFKFMELFTGGIMDTWVEIFQGDDDSSAGVPYWTGWLDTSNYEEPYEAGNVVMQLSCVDGLSLLKDILFASAVTTSEGEEEITYYNGRGYISTLLLYIFDKIGYSEFKEYVNIYEEEMFNTADDSPFDQSKIDSDVFQDMYCDEVLKRILEPFNASVRQHEGVFCIYRPKELINSTVYGRHFTGNQTKTSVTLSPDQYFHRTGHNTNLKQVPGGSAGLEDPARRIKMNFDYGNRESWFDYYNFPAEIFYDTIAGVYTGAPTYLLKRWTNSGWGSFGANVKPIGYYVPGEAEGVLVEGDEDYIYQDAIAALSTWSDSDLFTLDFDYGWYTHAGDHGTGAVSMQITCGSYYLVDSGDGINCEWTLVESSISFTGLYFDETNPWSDWTNHKRQFSGMPASGTLRIKLFGSNFQWTWSAFRNVKLFVTSSDIEKKKKVRTLLQRVITGAMMGGDKFHLANKYYWVKYKEPVDNIVENEYITGNDLDGQELEFDYILGDITDAEIENILGQFKGALSTIKRDTLEEAADDFYTDHNASYSGVVITTPTNTIVFTKSGGAFTGATSITNATGNLSGSVANTQAYAAGQTKIVRAFPTNASGSYDIRITDCDDKTMIFDTNEAGTCAAFVDAWAGYYNGVGFTITAAQETGSPWRWYVQFEAAFDFAISKVNQVPAFDVTFETVQTFIAVTPAIHTITLTGDYGTANIVCNGVAAKDIEIDETEIPTVEWATREEQSSGAMKKLLELIGDEIKHQYSRHTQMLSINIKELPGELLSPASSNDESNLNLLGNIQDTENQVDGENRIFVINRGTFSARSRTWKLDLAEIVR